MSRLDEIAKLLKHKTEEQKRQAVLAWVEAEIAEAYKKGYIAGGIEAYTQDKGIIPVDAGSVKDGTVKTLDGQTIKIKGEVTAIMKLTPTFRVGEVIYSTKRMGKIQFAYCTGGGKATSWSYVIEQPASIEHAHLEQIKEIDVVAVWRDNRWQTK